MCLSYWALAHKFVVYLHIRAKAWWNDLEHGEREICTCEPDARGLVSVAVAFRFCILSLVDRVVDIMWILLPIIVLYFVFKLGYPVFNFY